MEPQITPEDILKKEKKKAKNEMSLERIRLALERLQLAWLRFAMTMIALGFTSYRFFYSRVEEGKAPLLQFISGREIGIFLIAIGFLGLLQATRHHIRTSSKLKAQYKAMQYSVALIQSYLVLALALFLLLTVIFKV
jgi:uncharacterized membrane protein YidH (DUF202 family)